MGKKQEAIPKQNPPRKSEEIRQEYYQNVARSGELGYQIALFQEELKVINGRLKSLNYEMDARNKLDQAVAAEEQAKVAAKAAADATVAATAPVEKVNEQA